MAGRSSRPLFLLLLLLLLLLALLLLLLLLSVIASLSIRITIAMMSTKGGRAGAGVRARAGAGVGAAVEEGDRPCRRQLSRRGAWRITMRTAAAKASTTSFTTRWRNSSNTIQ